MGDTTSGTGTFANTMWISSTHDVGELVHADTIRKIPQSMVLAAVGTATLLQRADEDGCGSDDGDTQLILGMCSNHML